MKRKSKEADLRQLGDSKKMQEAIDWVELHDLDAYRTTPHCLHIEGVNFWPDKGTIQIRDEPKLAERGLVALAEILGAPAPAEVVVIPRMTSNARHSAKNVSRRAD